MHVGSATAPAARPDFRDPLTPGGRSAPPAVSRRSAQRASENRGLGSACRNFPAHGGSKRLMSRITRLLLCLLAVGLTVSVFTAGAAPARSAAAHHPAVGIGDNKPDMFKDPRFLALGIKNVRYDMSWDALTVTWQRQEVTAWMKAKKKAFSQVRVMPDTAQYINAFKAFRKKFPWVKQYVTWDETNCYCEVSFNREGQIASYYRALRSACSSCTILAAEFLDTAKQDAVPMKTWVSKLDKALGFQPGYWGLNDYEDANHLVSTQTRQLLGLVRGEIWLAETGGLVNRPAVKHPGFPQNASHAAKVDSYVLNTVGSLSPRIQRVYLYEWDAKT